MNPERPPRPTYVRTDDPKEKVQITSQERCINGKINFVFVEPQGAAGATSSLRANDFHRVYHDPEAEKQKKPWPPVRPSSIDPKDTWREWALYLESEVERLKRARGIFSQFPNHHGGLRP